MSLYSATCYATLEVFTSRQTVPGRIKLHSLKISSTKALTDDLSVSELVQTPSSSISLQLESNIKYSVPVLSPSGFQGSIIIQYHSDSSQTLEVALGKQIVKIKLPGSKILNYLSIESPNINFPTGESTLNFRVLKNHFKKNLGLKVYSLDIIPVHQNYDKFHQLHPIPGRIEAEHFDRNAYEGHEKIHWELPKKSREFSKIYPLGCHRLSMANLLVSVVDYACLMGELDENTQLHYQLFASQSGRYNIAMALRALEDKTTNIIVMINGKQIYKPFLVTQATETTAFRVASIYLKKGNHTLSLTLQSNLNKADKQKDEDSENKLPILLDYIEFSKSYKVHSQQKPLTSPIQIPGSFLTSQYDKGGKKIAYGDKTKGNAPRFGKADHCDRGDDVDLQALSNHSQTCLVTSTSAGEWLEYTVNITQPGYYRIHVNEYSQITGGYLYFQLNGQGITPAIKVTDNNLWASNQTSSNAQHQTLTSHTYRALQPGLHILRLVFLQENSDLSSGSFGNITFEHQPGATHPYMMTNPF